MVFIFLSFHNHNNYNNVVFKKFIEKADLPANFVFFSF